MCRIWNMEFRIWNKWSKLFYARMILAVFLVIFLSLILFIFVIGLITKPAKAPVFGVNFSKAHAEWLGLNWQDAFRSMLDDLGARAFRVPVNWNAIEQEEGKFYFNDIDWILSAARARDAKVILTIGRKLPRWPECHDPEWVKKLPRPELEKKTITMLKAVVEHTRESQAIAAWQIENEPFFRFGECGRPLGRVFLKKEIALVKSLDSRPIVLTDSGELSTWLRTAPLADVLGISMYRKVWHKWFGFLHYPIPPAYYTAHAKLISPFAKVIVTELQSEPWVTTSLHEMPVDEQYKFFNIKEFKDLVAYAKRTGFEEFYFWGAEWWYWLKVKKGDSTFWEEAKNIIRF